MGKESTQSASGGSRHDTCVLPGLSFATSETQDCSPARSSSRQDTYFLIATAAVAGYIGLTTGVFGLNHLSFLLLDVTSRDVSGYSGGRWDLFNSPPCHSKGARNLPHLLRHCRGALCAPVRSKFWVDRQLAARDLEQQHGPDQV